MVGARLEMGVGLVVTVVIRVVIFAGRDVVCPGMSAMVGPSLLVPCSRSDESCDNEPSHVLLGMMVEFLKGEVEFDCVTTSRFLYCFGGTSCVV